MYFPPSVPKFLDNINVFIVGKEILVWWIVHSFLWKNYSLFCFTLEHLYLKIKLYESKMTSYYIANLLSVVDLRRRPEGAIAPPEGASSNFEGTQIAFIRRQNHWNYLKMTLKIYIRKENLAWSWCLLCKKSGS